MGWQKVVRGVQPHKRERYGSDVIRVAREGKKSLKEGIVSLRFYIGEDAMRKMRWKIGDRVEIAQNGELFGLIPSVDGNKLSVPGGHGGNDPVGKITKAVVTFSCKEAVAAQFVNGKPRVMRDWFDDDNVLVIGESI